LLLLRSSELVFKLRVSALLVKRFRVLHCLLPQVGIFIPKPANFISAQKYKRSPWKYIAPNATGRACGTLQTSTIAAILLEAGSLRGLGGD
jgi:hypothetical protein